MKNIFFIIGVVAITIFALASLFKDAPIIGGFLRLSEITSKGFLIVPIGTALVVLGLMGDPLIAVGALIIVAIVLHFIGV